MIDSLSLKKRVTVGMIAEVPASNLTRLTLPHVAPPFEDVAATTPLSLFRKLTERLIA